MTLSFRGQPVAFVSEAFEHQGTWFADYSLAHGLTPRMLQFIEFNRLRLSEGEFDEEELAGFAEFYAGDPWHLVDADRKLALKDAPLFMSADEVSWVYP